MTMRVTSNIGTQSAQETANTPIDELLNQVQTMSEEAAENPVAEEYAGGAAVEEAHDPRASRTDEKAAVRKLLRMRKTITRRSGLRLKPTSPNCREIPNRGRDPSSPGKNFQSGTDLEAAHSSPTDRSRPAPFPVRLVLRDRRRSELLPRLRHP